MHRLPAFALILFISTNWWGDIVRAATAALGLDVPAIAEEQAPPPPRDPTTDSACSMDPWGGCGG